MRAGGIALGAIACETACETALVGDTAGAAEYGAPHTANAATSEPFGKKGLGVPILWTAGIVFAECDEPTAGASWLTGAVVVEFDALAAGASFCLPATEPAGEGGSRRFGGQTKGCILGNQKKFRAFAAGALN